MNRTTHWITCPILASCVLLCVMCWAVCCGTTCSAAELSKLEISMGSSIQATVRRAEQDYFNGKFDSSGKSLRRALINLDKALEGNNPDFYDRLMPLIKRIDKVHVLLELEGISVPPFAIPERPLPGAQPTKPDSTDPDTTTPEPTPSTPTPAMGVSFTKEVAPILNSKCGRCHVQGSRGGFSLSSYAVLMKGPREGVVVFPGDAIGSRLIETIETGDMPRGGPKVTPAELKTLKDWVLQGAKFDGQDPNAMLVSTSAPTPAAPRPPAPKVMRATGKETVSFASDIAPLLVENCSGCHIDAMQVRGGLRMDTFVRLMNGGDSGSMIVPGRGEASLLVKKLRGTAPDGERMPGGGRPPLSEDSIALVSKWIDEGATLDGEESQPIRVMSQLAWAASATSEEVSARRAEQADANLQLAGSAPSGETLTDHFRVVGTAAPETLELVGRLAEQKLRVAKTLTKSSGSAEDYFHGRATIFVMPKRYDYSEFAKMVEQRSVPSDWTSHWQFDGIDAYLSMVATDADEEEVIESRLLAPIVSLAVATRGNGVPRWFAEGIGSATALQQNAKSRSDKDKLQRLAVEAASSVKDAKAFLDNRLTPEQTDSFGTALAMSMLDRSKRRMLDSCLRSLAGGRSFEAAFFAGFGVTPEGYINAYLQYVR
ncbi:MAG: c-type cytochrome domain-containing protein [Planctomycetota bacterium]